MTVILVGIALLTSLIASVWAHVGEARMSERHHRHHDTYMVNARFTRSLLSAIHVIALLEVALVLCSRVFEYRAHVQETLIFFDCFLLTLFVAWALLRRYKVSVYDTQTILTPMIGFEKIVRHKEISCMAWCGIRKASGYRNLAIYVGNKRALELWGSVDIERILLRIDRYDAISEQGFVPRRKCQL